MPIYMIVHEKPDPLEKYREGRVVAVNPFINRLKLIWKVITKRNIVLVSYRLEDTPEGVMIYTSSIIRTDYNNKTDLKAVAFALNDIHEKLKEKE